MVANRDGVKRPWDLTSACLPHQITADRTTAYEAVCLAIEQSLRSVGIATKRQIMNHFVRGFYTNFDKALQDLVRAGRVVGVDVRGGGATWQGDWYIHADNVVLLDGLNNKDWVGRTVLLSPFDNLICDRERTELLWDFHFRLEIYVPKEKRKYGHYAMPILHCDRLIGRVDPKMDRKSSTLMINAVYAEPGAPMTRSCGRAIANSINQLARFLNADRVTYGDSIPDGWKHPLTAHCI